MEPCSNAHVKGECRYFQQVLTGISSCPPLSSTPHSSPHFPLHSSLLTPPHISPHISSLLLTSLLSIPHLLSLSLCYSLPPLSSMRRIEEEGGRGEEEEWR